MAIYPELMQIILAIAKKDGCHIKIKYTPLQRGTQKLFSYPIPDQHVFHIMFCTISDDTDLIQQRMFNILNCFSYLILNPLAPELFF